MTIDIQLTPTTVTEFGVGLDEAGKQRFVSVPVDQGVQTALREMVTLTRDEMVEIRATTIQYEPSEKYSTNEHLTLPIASSLASQIRQIHQAVNLPDDSSVVDNPQDIFCYFARISDGHGGNRVTAIRRASSFKGVLKSRIITWASDALKIVKDNVFKLDDDFDLLVDDDAIYIFRPTGFDFLGKLNDAILAAAPSNAKLIEKDIKYVNFSPIAEYAAKHPRAARYLASIRGQKETKNIDKDRLKALCAKTGVVIKEENGKIVVDKGSIMDFLGVLDRRMYEVELIKGSPESFRAGSRSRIVLSK